MSSMKCLLCVVAISCSISTVRGDEQPPRAQLRDQAIAAMRRATMYYWKQVARHGGYVYYYSPDLQRRLGEGVASRDQIWVQPPGTPTVAMAYLDAYRSTGDSIYLTAATEAALALRYGQLESGGWTNSVEFDPASANVARYRFGKGRGRNFSTLDDGITQAATRLMMQADAAHGRKHAKIRESAKVVLKALLAAQFPNGAFPQGWDNSLVVDAGDPRFKPTRANYPDYDWRTEGRVKEYWHLYTLNDGLAQTVARTLVEAHRFYDDPRYLAALKQLGDFLILAQMPAPQPAWAQQYTYSMRPAWARKFEPPAIAGRESQDVMQTLLLIHQLTGDTEYLKPIQPAIDYLRRSQLADGRLARYYELQSNRPLYMQRQGKKYELTYSDARVPSHYGWKVESQLDSLERSLKQARQQAGTSKAAGGDTKSLAQLEQQVRKTIAALDADGRWITTYRNQLLVGQPKFQANEQFLSSQVFCDNLRLLARYVRATKP